MNSAMESTSNISGKVIELKDKVKDDGLIMGHDWILDPKHRHYGVHKAVTEFCKKYNWKVISF